jgi:hypothetical protein
MDNICDWQPCMNGGTCIPDPTAPSTMYTCQCWGVYTGFTCNTGMIEIVLFTCIIYSSSGCTWSGWSACSLICGNGIRYRTRAQDQQANCTSPLLTYEYENCNSIDCQSKFGYTNISFDLRFN